MAGELETAEVRQVARLLKEAPDLTVHQAIRLLRQPPEITSLPDVVAAPALSHTALRNQDEWQEGSVVPSRSGRPSGIERLDWVRGHLARVERQGLTAADRKELLRLLRLIQKDVSSLIAALKSGAE
jgi:hypothetical protein